MTIAQIRLACSALLQSPPRDPTSIAADITHQLRRNEQARRSRWRKRGLVAPAKKIVE